MSSIHRIRQVAKYGWQHAGQISQESFEGKKRIALFYDIFCCYQKYGMWSNQYLKERFWELEKSEREKVGNKYKEANLKKEAWVKDFYENRNFYIKYGDIKYEKESLREKRNEAYAKRYNAGKNLFVENDVNISRQHYLDGKILIGDNVLIAKHVFIDYSGEIIIHDNVALANGVIIETHTHILKEKKGAVAIPTRLEIGEYAQILSRAYIADTCHSIGRYAKIGAGSYVRNNIPPYAMVIGNPARIIGFRYSPEEMVAFEEANYPMEERTPIDKYEEYYDKYFRKRNKEIKNYIKL